ncbi:MAG: hypothetical protein KatS3mg132_147 [Limisphaera sp.]|nr:MAG: hypothetical protein KatS3mg132_147 [Limisphaera sp.]
MFLVSGTASAQAREWREVSERAGVPVFCLFEEGTRFESGSDREKKVAMCAAGLVRIGRAVLCLGQPPAEGTSPVDPGVWLRPLARAAGSVWRESVPNLVLVEGGATAAALLEDFPWGAWRAVREWAPGVVELRAPQADTPAVIVKPGSYPWPDSIRELWFAGRRL